MPEKGKTALLELPGGPGAARRVGLAHFEKELIRAGTFTHPEKGFTVEVTPERMGKWVEAFRAMKAGGVSVPIPYGHSYDARDNAGFLEEMWVEDGSLYGLLAIPKDADAEIMGQTATEVSISLNPDFVDGSGKRYGQVIEHVAITNYPVVPGQENFKKLEGLSDGPLEVIRLERTEEKAMGKEGEGQTAPAGGTDTSAGLALELERTRGEKESLARELEAGRKNLAAAAEKIRKLGMEAVKSEVESLVSDGKIVASDENKADVAALLSAEGEGALQLAAGDGEKKETPAVVFRRFLSRLPEGAVVKLGRVTGAASQSGDGDSDVAKEEAQKSLEAAGLAAKK